MTGFKLIKTIALILAFFLIQGCVPKTTDITPEPVPTEKRPYGPAQPLDEFLSNTYSQQYSPAKSIFQADRRPDYSEMILLSREKPVLTLADNVTSYAGQGGILAAGFTSGEVRVWSDWPCPGFNYSSQEAVHNVWIGGHSPYVAVCGDNQQQVDVFDLRSCSLAHEITAQGPVQTIAVSSDAGQIALVDQGRRLWKGNPDDELEHQETLRNAPLAISFTPKGGVLMVVDKTGWLVKWTVPEYEVLESILIPDGPFEVARFTGSRLVMGKKDSPGSAVVWDIPAGQPAAENMATGEYLLDNQILYYILPEEKPVKRVFMSAPELQAQVYPDKMIIKVRDLDGTNRYFHARTGEESEGSETHTGFQPVQVQPTGEFSWADTDYTLADPVLSSNDSTLWSRFIPDQGHYLWWTASRDSQPGTFQQRLPVRQNIRAEIPPEWVDLK